MSLEILGYVGGMLVAASIIPQVIKSWKTKSTKDISLARYAIYSIGITCYIGYAYSISSVPLMVMQTVELVLALSMVFLKVRYG